MLTVKLYEEEHNFHNANDAVDFIIKNDFKNDVVVYDINTNAAYQKTKPIYEAIRKYNEGKPLNEQILPTNPFGFRGILGCLGVMCYSISFGTYEHNKNLLALFTGYNHSVLDTSTESANICPSIKALSSLSMLC